MGNLARTYRTVRHLRLKQLLYQVYYRLCRIARWQKPRASSASLELCEVWPETVSFSLPSGHESCVSPSDWSFSFVGLQHSFGEQIDWKGSPHGKLWDYNLHYFEWLWSFEPSEARAVVKDWINGHEYQQDAVGWEPYPLSLRLINWVGYWGSKGRALIEEDAAFREALLVSIAEQCNWLSRRLERHILANHYLENGAALWIASQFVKNPEAAGWAATGESILTEQLAEQILDDGMQFERSPMYHNRIVWLLEILAGFDPERFGLMLDRTKAAAGRLRHPDGKIALFNDSAFGIYPEPEVASFRGVFSMESAGYYGVSREDGTYIICDAGPLGPDYQPGHAHCDIGSFEMSLSGQRFITDTGVFHYLDTPQRRRSRSTAAHNVLAPEGLEQAEIWSAFRVGDRPQVDVETWEHNEDGFSLQVRHDGFQNQGVTVSRKLSHTGSNQFLIDDAFESRHEINMVGHIHFAPEVTVAASDEGGISLNHAGKNVRVSLSKVDSHSIVEADYYPEFNVCKTRQALRYNVSGVRGSVQVCIDWNE